MNNIPEDWLSLRSLCFGDTCLIVGNGPSLKNVPVDFLNKYDSLGSNRVYLMDGFDPTFYACVNPLMLEQITPELQKFDCSVKFIAEAFANLIPGSFPLHSRPVPSFSLDPWNGIYEGHTVTFVLMQIAFFLGYSTVLLVGVDHRYSADPNRQNPNVEIVSDGPDPDHFDPDYFGKGFAWNLPDLEKSEIAYHMAKTMFESKGRKIFNLTEGSSLTIFETQKVEDWA